MESFQYTLLFKNISLKGLRGEGGERERGDWKCRRTWRSDRQTLSLPGCNLRFREWFFESLRFHVILGRETMRRTHNKPNLFGNTNIMSSLLKMLKTIRHLFGFGLSSFRCKIADEKSTHGAGTRDAPPRMWGAVVASHADVLKVREATAAGRGGGRSFSFYEIY